MAKDGKPVQKEEGICPVKLLLLALIATRLLIFSHVVDGNSPVPVEAVEADIKDDDAARGHQLLRKATGEQVVGQVEVMPSHAQQSMPFRHDMAMPLSCDSPARNWRRELFSCSRHAMVELAMESSSNSNAAAARPEKGIDSLLLHRECGVSFMISPITAVFGLGIWQLIFFS
uniref:Uncharacterized protein n=1 Tax=Oryza meridionalis TaxID=40149 RepID=A0A0E0CFT4_9ORYZ